MSDILLHLDGEQIITGRLEGASIVDLKCSARKDKHPLLLLQETLSGWEISTLAGAIQGLVSGGKAYSRELGNVDFFDLLSTQFGAPALLLPEGQAAALAAAEKEPVLAAHLGQETSFGYWNGEELLRGSQGLAGAPALSIGTHLLEDIYEDLEGVSLDWKSILQKEDAAMERFAEIFTQCLYDVSRFCDPGRIVLSGGELLLSAGPFIFAAWEKCLDRFANPLLRSPALEISALGELAPIFGAAKMLVPDPLI